MNEADRKWTSDEINIAMTKLGQELTEVLPGLLEQAVEKALAKKEHFNQPPMPTFNMPTFNPFVHTWTYPDPWRRTP